MSGRYEREILLPLLYSYSLSCGCVGKILAKISIFPLVMICHGCSFFFVLFSSKVVCPLVVQNVITICLFYIDFSVMQGQNIFSPKNRKYSTLRWITILSQDRIMSLIISVFYTEPPTV